MSKLNIANLKKTIYYLKRNGLRDTYLAALERLRKKTEEAYVYEAPTAETLDEQRAQARRGKEGGPYFSILVPAYRTNPDYLKAMVDSVLMQSYEHLELIIADASEDMSVESVVKEYRDERIRYLHLTENKGISDNTNAALGAASGDYIGLLDHDDLLTPDALFEMAYAIQQAKRAGVTLQLLYSDEDKCDETGHYYYEPHRKKEFNLDLILSNNYICHFTVMQAGLMKKLMLRREYDGAQDYDLVLRGIQTIFNGKSGEDDGVFWGIEAEKMICHIPKVLYHWRCHRGSTAENPQSKQYAYEAGGRAIADFLKENGMNGQVIPTKHLGFYRIAYQPDLLSERPDVGAVGGKLLDRNNKITGGIYTKEGECPYKGLYKDFSGYMHRASLLQDAFAVDIRLMKIRPELFSLAEAAADRYLVQTGPDIRCGQKNTTGESIAMEEDGTVRCLVSGLTEQEYCALSIAVCKAIQDAGYHIVWNPDWRKKA
ncbi:MAG: glycosyltransferase [Lachnospiraceae bacterium]